MVRIDSIDGSEKFLRIRRDRRDIFFEDLRGNLYLAVDAVLEYLLFVKTRSFRDGYYQVGLDLMAACKNGFAGRFQNNGTFFARTFTAANAIEDYPSAGGSFEQRDSGVQVDSFLVGFESNVVVFHQAQMPIKQLSGQNRGEN
jgi:hypothetical protein